MSDSAAKPGLRMSLALMAIIAIANETNAPRQSRRKVHQNSTSNMVISARVEMSIRVCSCCKRFDCAWYALNVRTPCVFICECVYECIRYECMSV